jgi:hypothetical protein
VIASWTSAFLIPLVAVIVVQMARVEAGRKIWTVLTAFGGAMMSIFLVLPPLFFGVAAYTQDLLVFWSPLTLFGLWIGVMSFLLLRAIKAQRGEVDRGELAELRAEA